MKDNLIEVDNYGDMLAQVFDCELLFYGCIGHYQGTYIAILEGRGFIEVYTGYYGSCSGCDFLESEKNFTDEIEYKKALEYCKDFRPTIKIPSKIWGDFTMKKKMEIIKKSAELLGCYEERIEELFENEFFKKYR